MDFYIARHPVMNRRKEVFGYKLELCRSLRDRFYNQYREPDDAEALYRQLCFSGLAESVAKPLAIIDFSEEMFESLIPLFPRKSVIVEYGSAGDSEKNDLRDLQKIKRQGYKILFNGTAKIRPAVTELTDLVKLDFSAISAEEQLARVKSGGGRMMYYAGGVNTWEDYRKAALIGYDYFQGDFFMKPLAGRHCALWSFSAPVLRVLSELAAPEPSFKEITKIIEHDVNLSYSLLKLVNSAYAAPKFRVKTISQAVTLLGLNELNEFMSTIILRQIWNSDNGELLRRSLIRGKFMDLLASSSKIPQKGSEAFFTGIFSLLDVILNAPMASILEELPITDGVKEALLGRAGELGELLDMVRLYETARWQDFESVYGLAPTEQEQMMNYYLMALRWAESFDF